MIKFRKDEWVLSFYGEGSAEVRLVRLAENVHDGQESCLCYFGGYATTRYTVKYIHKLPTSMKNLIPKDTNGKKMTTVL